MKIDYDVGDCVVCINDTPQPGYPKPDVQKGKMYRVKDISDCSEGFLVVNLEGVDVLCDMTHEYWHDARRFRKLPKADTEFTEMLRAIKSVKQVEPA